MEFITQTWPWYVAGPVIAFCMFALLFFGKTFGMSNNLKTMCSIGGANRFVDFFKIDTKKQYWNLAFVLGSILGGFIASRYLSNNEGIMLASSTIETLRAYGFQNVGGEFLPQEIFGLESLASIKGLMVLLLGGFLVGIRARYAGGCTSGHAISGLSNLQIPSLIAVIGFFVGGLLMVHVFMPFIF